MKQLTPSFVVILPLIRSNCPNNRVAALRPPCPRAGNRRKRRLISKYPTHILQPVAKQHKISSRQDGDTRNGHIDDQHDQGRVQITAAFSSGNLAPELLQNTLTDVTDITGGTLLASAMDLVDSPLLTV